MYSLVNGSCLTTISDANRVRMSNWFDAVPLPCAEFNGNVLVCASMCGWGSGGVHSRQIAARRSLSLYFVRVIVCACMCRVMSVASFYFCLTLDWPHSVGRTIEVDALDNDNRLIGVNCTIQQKIWCTFIGKAFAVFWLKVHLLRMQLIIESIAFALDDTEMNWANEKRMHTDCFTNKFIARQPVEKKQFPQSRYPPSGLCVLIVLDLHMHASSSGVLIFGYSAEPHEIHEFQKLSGPKLSLIATGENFIWTIEKEPRKKNTHTHTQIIRVHNIDGSGSYKIFVPTTITAMQEKLFVFDV